MVKRAAKVITTPTAIRSLLSEGIFISANPEDRVRMLNDVLPLAVEADKAGANPESYYSPFHNVYYRGHCVLSTLNVYLLL